MSEAGPLVLGIDLGTTAVKCALHGRDGSCLATATSEYDLLTAPGMVVEVAPETYWSALKQTVGEVLAAAGAQSRHIAALGISCQGETLVPVGADGSPLRNAIVWLDSRAEAESVELADRFGARCYEVTGQTEMVPTWPASKALWLRRHEPEVMDRTAKLLLLEDWAVARLTGEYACEGSLVTSTAYWDFRRKIWWTEMLDHLGLEVSQLPELVEPGAAVAPLRPQVADELGLPASTLVCMGALDQACGAIGVGNVRPGVFSENTGAAVAICATLHGPVLDPEARMPCHYHGLPDTYMFHTFTGGGVTLQWYRDELCGAEREVARAAGTSAYRVIDDEVATVPAGAEGLVMIPHLQGAMAPESNPRARGAFVGLTLRHGKAHLARAVLESIAFVIRHNIEVLESLGVEVATIRSLGGGARSAVWKQIEADVTGRPVAVTAQLEAATLGAAILAGAALKWYGSAAEAAESMVSVRATYEPDEATHRRYDDAYGTYRAAVDALRSVFDRPVFDSTGGGDA